MEEPFFLNFKAATGLPVKVTYRPLDTVGFKDNIQLQMLRDGMFDLVSLRFIQNSEVEPGLLGIDPVGMSSDFETARRVATNYSPTLDRYLQKTHKVKLLGVWTFGPQIFFCSKPVSSVVDFKGLKVRIPGKFLEKLIKSLGATPAVINFDDTKIALANGLVDCAVTSAASGNFAGWPEHTRYYFPLAAHYGLNGYAISLNKWNDFTKQEQESFKAAFDQYIDNLWQFAQELELNASNCNIGRSCSKGNAHNMIYIEPSAKDIQTIKELAKSDLLPEWFKKCEGIHPGCQSEWSDKVLPVVH